MEPSFDSALISILMLFLILFAAYFTTRFAGLRLKRMSRSSHMEIIDQIVLARDKTILLLKVGEDILVVGVTSQGMNTLAKIPASELDAIPAVSTQSFGSILKDSLRRMGIPGFQKEEDIDRRPDDK